MEETFPTGVYVIIATLAFAFLLAIGMWVYRWLDSIYPLITIHEYERAVRYVGGKLAGVSEPGHFRYRAAKTELVAAMAWLTTPALLPPFMAAFVYIPGGVGAILCMLFIYRLVRIRRQLLAQQQKNER